jgi:acetyl-CoA C-acetyltransferase
MSTVFDSGQLPDHTPIIVGAAQHTVRLDPEARPPFDSPMDLAGAAARRALDDAGIEEHAGDIDTVAVTRLFSDSPGAWHCPFGGSNNPPESVARRIGASPAHRLYSDAGGNQPLTVLREMLQGIARGEKALVLMTGAEAIASERFAQRNGLEDDWKEEFDAPLDSRQYPGRFACPEELASGMYLPVHYYALIENRQAHQLGHDPAQHRRYMAEMMAPFSQVAAANPYAQKPRARPVAELVDTAQNNYLISLPYSRLLVARDAVNQAAALVVTSVGRARQLGIDPARWIFLQGYAEGAETYLSGRADPARSGVMRNVLTATLERAGATAGDMDLIDIYSCFPCAVEAACDSLDLPRDGSRGLTVTGGLPFFGGPGNNYSMHALAEMVVRLRGSERRALVTANGGVLSKHAAAVLANAPAAGGVAPIDWAADAVPVFDAPAEPAVAMSADPKGGRILTYTVMINRKGADTAIILGETDSGERFLAHSDDPAVTGPMASESPIGRAVLLERDEKRYRFRYA